MGSSPHQKKGGGKKKVYLLIVSSISLAAFNTLFSDDYMKKHLPVQHTCISTLPEPPPGRKALPPSAHTHRVASSAPPSSRAKAREHWSCLHSHLPGLLHPGGSRQQGWHVCHREHQQGLQIPPLPPLAGAGLQAAARMGIRLPRGLRQESRLLPFTYQGDGLSVRTNISAKMWGWEMTPRLHLGHGAVPTTVCCGREVSGR